VTRLIQIADIHFGREDPAAINAAGDLISSLDPDGLLVCGDLTQRGKRSEFEAAAEWLQSLEVPFISVPGNHDTPLLNLFERVVSPFIRYEKRFSAMQPFETFGSVRVHGMNTSRGWQARKNWAEGSVDMEDLQSIIERDRSVADETGGGNFGCLICHHPFRSPPTAPMQTRTRRGRRASKMLADSTIGLLLCGHVHTPSANIWGDDETGRYLCLTSGTLSTRLRNWPSSFNVLDFNDGCLTVTQQNFESAEYRATVFGRWSMSNLEPLEI
tara:strand:+ start:36630 stop:37442 length:813 start_codon:yes stop_codon:yes gene_type:complete